MEVGQIVYAFRNSETFEYSEEIIHTIKKSYIGTICNSDQVKYRYEPYQSNIITGVVAHASAMYYGSFFVLSKSDADLIVESRKIEFFDVNSYNNIKSPKKPIMPSLKSTTPTEMEIVEYQTAMSAYQADLAVYANKQIEYGNAVHVWYELFIKHLIKTNGMDSYPEKVHDIVYGAAYEQGHSSGYSEIAIYYSRFSSLAIDIIKAVKDS